MNIGESKMNISEKIERANAIASVSAQLLEEIKDAEQRYAELSPDSERWIVESRREAFMQAKIKREVIEWLLK